MQQVYEMVGLFFRAGEAQGAEYTTGDLPIAGHLF